LFIQGFGFLLMPALAWGLAATLNGIGSPPYVGEGLVLLACLPTTVAGSITLSRLAGDDGSTAAVNAIVGNLLGIILTPLLILVLTARVDFYGSPELIARLALIIALPMAVGLCIGRLSGVQRLRPWATSAMQSFLLGLLYLAFMRAAWRDVHVPLAEVLIIIVLAGVFYVAMLFCADALAQALGYREPRRSCLAIAGGQKTLAFGIPILSLVFEDTPALALMLLPLLAYHPLQILIGTIFAQQRGKALEAPCDNAPSS
jgi:sodium/bile acid cotransporter 7